MGTRRDSIIDGMAMALWQSAVDERARRGVVIKKFTSTGIAQEQLAAIPAAEDLCTLIENMNDETIDKLYEKQKRREPKFYAFGYDLARGATESNNRMRDSLLGVGIVLPVFSIAFTAKNDALDWHGEAESGRRSRVNPKSPDDVPHTKSVAEVRRILAGIKASDRCSDKCPGWAVFDTTRGFEIQVCDECMSSLAKHLRLSDDDVAQLPEAQKALADVEAEYEENPSSVLTAKGERMYEEIRAEYERKGEPRAKEIAMRTVYARAADGVPGLLKRHGRPPGVSNGRR